VLDEERREKYGVVTCSYCEHHEFEYDERTCIIRWNETAYCKKKNIKRELQEEICDEFVIKRGMFTQKWYPGERKEVEYKYNFHKK